MRSGSIRCGTRVACLLLLMTAGTSSAQGVGSGPLTGALTSSEPTTSLFEWGVTKATPGLIVSELGWDSNVFDQRDNQQQDYVFRGTPDIAVFTGLRFAQLSAYAGSELTYYRSYPQERSVGHEYRGRVDMMVSRFRPYFGGGVTRTRTRPNGEIDVRADRKQQEISGGVAFELGPHQQVYAGAVRFRSGFRNAVEEGVDLSTTLNHDSTSYTAGVKTDLTPLTSIIVSGGIQQDRFERLPLRNSDNRIALATIRIGAEAAVSGSFGIGYRDFDPIDPLIEPFRGVTASGALTYPFLEIGRLGLSFIRGMEYSFDEAEAYYKETTINLVYTHRLLGEFDAQARGAKSLFDYGFREGVVARRDTLDTAGGSVGYNLRNRTRIALNYEYSRRRSPAFEERNYDRRRMYLSWAYAF